MTSAVKGQGGGGGWGAAWGAGEGLPAPTQEVLQADPSPAPSPEAWSSFPWCGRQLSPSTLISQALGDSSGRAPRQGRLHPPELNSKSGE